MEFTSGNIFIRPMCFAQMGAVVNGHAHNFDHTTYIIRGAVKIEKLNEAGEVVKTITKKASDGHNWALIKAGVCHRITALEADTEAHCIYAHRNPQGDVVEEYEGWAGAYE